VPYVGRGLTTGAQYQKLDDIAINNATTFTMSVGSANVSPDQNHLILVVNGVIQEPGTGFTVAGSTCTLASAITTSGHSGTDTIYGVIAGDAAFAAYDSIGVNALGVTAGTVTASRAIVPDSNKDIASFRNVTLTGELDAATLDISGNADIDGTTNLDAVDIDGAVQIDATFTSGVDGQGYDTKLFGDTSGAYIMWDTSADDLIFVGAAGLDIAGDIDIDGTANLDVVDIDGAVNMAADLTMGANILMADDTSIGIADDAERIEFDGAGDISVLGANFGIGTAAPAVNLDIYGATNDNTGLQLSTYSTTNGTLPYISFRKSDNNTVGTVTQTDDGDYLGQISFNGVDSNNSFRESALIQVIQDGSSGASKVASDMLFLTGTSSASATERMRIDSGGNVGIGTSAPLATLSVAQAFDGATDAGIGFYSSSNANYRNYISSNLSGSANASVMHFYVNQSSGAETQVMTLKGEGNVGIGEAAPETQVEISGTAPYLTFHNTTHEDADGGRETKIKFKGERSGGEELTMAQIYLMQQGSEDDNNSLMRFQVNTNAGGVDTLTAMLDLDSSSDVKVMSGDLVFSAAGKGIVLGVTSNADENTLDDYEEGTFSPTFLGSSSNPTQSYAYQVGIYTKIGREVILHGRIGLSGSGITPGSGTLQLGNLPFTSLSTTHSHGSVVISFSGDFLTANTGAPTHGYVNYNAVTCDLYTYDNDAGNVASTTATNAADADENAGILYSVTYTAA